MRRTQTRNKEIKRMREQLTSLQEKTESLQKEVEYFKENEKFIIPDFQKMGCVIQTVALIIILFHHFSPDVFFIGLNDVTKSTFRYFGHMFYVMGLSFNRFLPVQLINTNSVLKYSRFRNYQLLQLVYIVLYLFIFFYVYTDTY